MKKLKESFGRHGLKYHLIKRNNKLCIYGVSGTYTDKILHYEVMLIRINKARIFGNVNLPESEGIPSDKGFGKTKPDIHFQKIEIAEQYFNIWNDCLEKNMEGSEITRILSEFTKLPDKRVRNRV